MEEQEIELIDYLRVIWRRKLLIIVGTLVCIISAAIVSLLMPPIYQAHTLLWVTKPKWKVELEPKIQTGPSEQETEGITETYRHLLRNRLITERVLSSLKSSRIALDGLTPEALENMIKIETIRNTNLLRLQVEDTHPQRVALLVNNWASLFVGHYNELRLKEQRGSLDFINQQLQTAKAQLMQAEENLKAFQEADRIGLLQKEIESCTNKIVELNNRLADVERELKVENTVLKEGQALLQKEEMLIKTRKTLGDDTLLSQMGNHPEVDSAKKPSNRLNLLSEELNPSYLNLKQKVINSQLTVRVLQTQAEQLQKDFQRLNQELPDLQKELAAAQLQKTQLERKLATAQEPFSILTKKAEELKIATGTDPGTISIAVPAYTPEKPIKPKKRLNVMLAGAVGLMVTVFLAFFLEYLQTAALKKEP